MKLPDELSYLEAVIEELKSFPAEDLSDDNPDAMDIIEPVLFKRIEGMSKAEAKQAIMNDSAQLNNLGSQEPVLNFINGALMGFALYGM